MESLLGIRDYQPLLHARVKAKPSAKGKTKASAKAEEIRELLATPPESESEHGAEAGGMGEAGFDALAQDLEEVISEAELSEAVDFWVQCDECKAWRQVSSQAHEQFSGDAAFVCKLIGAHCSVEYID